MAVDMQEFRHSDAIREYVVVSSGRLWTLFDLLLLGGLLAVYCQQGSTMLFWTCAVVVAHSAVFKLVQVKEESLMVMHNFGLLLTKVNVLGTKKRKFIDHTLIKSVIINEGITGNKVIFYLAVNVDGEQKLTLPFEHHYPRYNALIRIYRGVRCVLWEEPDD